MVVYHDHGGWGGVAGGAGAAAKAAGWVRRIEAREDGIWADIEWTAAAATAIAAKEYRYLSPVIPHHKDGRVVMILSVALTNVPATHLEALSATLTLPTNDRTPDMDKVLAALLAALGLPQGTDETAVLAAINAMLTGNAALAAALGLPAAAKPADIQAAVTSLVAERRQLVEAAGLAADVKGADAIAALTALKGKGSPDPTKFVPIEQVTALQADLKALKDATTAGAAEAAVAEAMRQGKIAPALKGWAIDLFKADKAKFDTFVGAAPALTSQQLKTPVLPAGDTAALTAEQLTSAKLLGIDPKAYAATLKAEREAAL